MASQIQYSKASNSMAAVLGNHPCSLSRYKELISSPHKPELPHSNPSYSLDIGPSNEEEYKEYFSNPNGPGGIYLIPDLGYTKHVSNFQLLHATIASQQQG